MSKKSSRSLILAALDWTRPKDPPMSLSQASIVANVKRFGFDVSHKSWAVNRENFDPHSVVEYAMERGHEHSYFGLGAYVWNEPHVQAILKGLRANGFPGKIILGGPQISYSGPGLEKLYPDVDLFIRGYAEQAVVQILKGEKGEETRGVHVAGHRDKCESAVVDLDELPSPYLNGLLSPQTFIRWETQRGCPFHCSFCQHREPDDQKLARRPLNRHRVLKEVDWICAHNDQIRDIAVLDPTFNSGPHYVDVLRRFVDGHFSGKLSLQCRMEMMVKGNKLNEQFMGEVEALNERGHVVLELGLQTVHRNEWKLINRPNNLASVRLVLTETRRRNIATEVSLIFGLPGQTYESFAQSVDFCMALKVPTIYAYPLMLLRGTPLHDRKNDLHLTESSDICLDGINRVQQLIPHVVSSDTFDYGDWQRMARLAQSLDQYNEDQKMRDTLKNTAYLI